MFIGREEQLEQLKALWRKPVASLVTCRGRRRVGKSTLIEEFARRNRVRFIKLEGVEPQQGVNNETQLKAFGLQLAEQTGCEESQPENWFKAFARLSKVLNPREKTVLLIDEISWMGKYDAAFPGELKYAWDNRFPRESFRASAISSAKIRSSTAERSTACAPISRRTDCRQCRL